MELMASAKVFWRRGCLSANSQNCLWAGSVNPKVLDPERDA